MDFQQEVLDASHSTPVLVDFWAPWCGPCLILGPILDRLADEQSDRWVLAKVNVDEQQDVAARYGVRGIPAVKLFVDGVVAGEFVGALPEHAVRAWLDEQLPSESAQQLREAVDTFREGNRADARQLLDQVVASSPYDVTANVLLSALTVWDDPADAVATLDGLEIVEPWLVQLADATREVAATLSEDFIPADGPGRDKFGEAVIALRSGNYDAAAEAIIEVLAVDRYYDDDRPRRLGVALFTLLGPAHDVTIRRRRSFDMALF